MIWQPPRCRTLPKVTEKGKRRTNNGLREPLPGGGVTPEMCAIMPCNVEQAVCVVHKAPYLGIGVKQAVCLVGEDLCEACKQSNETIGSDDVT